MPDYGHSVNIIGIHLKTEDASKESARQWWFRHAGKTFPVYFDDHNMLENTFVVRVAPANFLYFPLKNKILSHVGDLSWAEPSLLELIHANTTK